MKLYSTKIIREFIETHKENIETVECGMREDWSWTADTIYSDGEYQIGVSGSSVRIAGIVGSQWATPIMEVTYKDGRREILDCYTDDGEAASADDVRKMKEFAFGTGGMDFKF